MKYYNACLFFPVIKKLKNHSCLKTYAKVSHGPDLICGPEFEFANPLKSKKEQRNKR